MRQFTSNKTSSRDKIVFNGKVFLNSYLMMPYISIWKCITYVCTNIISMAWCGTALSPMLTHWRCCSLALGHRFCLPGIRSALGQQCGAIMALSSLSQILTMDTPWLTCEGEVWGFHREFSIWLVPCHWHCGVEWNIMLPWIMLWWHPAVVYNRPTVKVC